jgi:hypothetical protein
MVVCLILLACTELAPGTVLADGPGLTVPLAESTIKSILAEAVPLSMTDVRFSAVEVRAKNQRAAAKNVLPYLAYVSQKGDDFYPPPAESFVAQVDDFYANAYFVILSHPVSGMRIIHLFINTGGGEHFYLDQDDPDFQSEPGGQWRFTVSTLTPDRAGDYMYLPVFMPYDGDGYPVNPRTARWPFTIQP